jgi:hypothetical protein
MTEQIPPLLEVVDHYRTAAVLETVDGRSSIDDVSGHVVAAVDAPPSAASIAARAAAAGAGDGPA